MESFYFHIISCFANQSDQPLLELRGSRPRESEHQQLFMFYILKQQERRQFMNQHPCLSTSRPRRHDNAARHVVGNDFLLLFRQLGEEFLIFSRCDVSLDFTASLPFEIFGNETFVVHLEIVAHILLCRSIVTHHQVGIFAHDMHLLDFLLVELVEHAVVLQFVAQLIFFQPADGHCLIQHHETTIQFQRTDVRQIQERLLHFIHLGILKRVKEHPPLGFDNIQ